MSLFLIKLFASRVQDMIFITLKIKPSFNNKRSRNSHPKICRIIRKKSQKQPLRKNSQNLQENT